MIDIHTHILPGIDDGPMSWDESLALVRQGCDDGIEGFVATSHVLDRLDAPLEKRYRRVFEELSAKIEEEQLPVALWLGSELHCLAEFSAESPLATFNGNGRYTLIELPLGSIPARAGELLFSLALKDVVPVLAHPERNRDIQHKPSIIWDYVRRGVLLQVNAGSVTGRFGRQAEKTARLLLDHDLVSFVASDCHSAATRPMVLSSAFRSISRQYGNGRAQTLFRDNPLKVVQGERIDIADPGRYPARRRPLFRLFGQKKRW
ncbi:hypothetical protein JXO52_01155 [bacterium]|nr:hypothetical protein [bacterium]